MSIPSLEDVQDGFAEAADLINLRLKISDTSSSGRALIAALDYAAMRSLLGLVPGVANGIMPLGSDGKASTTYLPDAVLGALRYQGAWNASTNSPTIPTAATANKGYYFVVGTAGATSISGITDWLVGDWLVSNGTVWEKIDNTDMITSVAGLTGAITAASLGAALKASGSDFRTGTNDDRLLTPKSVFDAAAPVALTDASTVALDLATGQNFTLEIGGNRTLGAPTNAKAGQSGVITITQDGTGSRTLAYASAYKKPGGTITLSTAAGAVDLLSYYVEVGGGSPIVRLGLAKAFS